MAETTTSLPRNCPICGEPSQGIYFPYATRFNEYDFHYLKCASCATVFVDPVPDEATFRKMYAKVDYHDCHYDEVNQDAYRESVDFLAKHVPVGEKVLDYGCGTGAFLAACTAHGYISFGVDFDPDVARTAGKRGQCESYSVAEFESMPNTELFDAIHLGDVLEHLPDPLVTLSSLAGKLRAGGVLHIEGPIEVNASLVYWAALSFGRIKRILRPNFIATHPPTHLLRTDAVSQRCFFLRLGEQIECIDWRVEETGWPYRNGNILKRSIACIARAMGGGSIAGITFGNRFKIVLRKRQTPTA